MLNQVELGLGRVVAEHAVVVAGIALHRVFVLLQVLWEVMEREGGREKEEEVTADGRLLGRHH